MLIWLRTHRRFVEGFVLCGFLLVLFVPFQHSYTEESMIPVKTIKNKTSDMELGTVKVQQNGAEGVKTTTYKTNESLFDLVFRNSIVKKYDIVDVVSTQPQDNVMSVGTRRYQYMICSSGGYRYFTDEQFKDETVGFTSKSEDYCAKNNEGVKTKLADTVTGQILTQTSQQNNQYIDPSCHKENIIHYSTVSEDVSYLPTGTQQIGTPGRDGFTLVCPILKGVNSHTDFAVQNQITYVGTGKTAQQTADEQSQAEQLQQEQIYLQRKNEQMFNQSHCISSLRAQGMLPDEAKWNCESLYPIP